MAGVPAKSGEEYTFYFSVTSQADTDVFQATPTIAAGDFQYSNDAGGTFNNPGTIPAVTVGNNRVIEATLSDAEMTPAAGDKILFWGHDQVGAEWQDYGREITVTTQNVDDLSTLTAAGVWNRLTTLLTTASSIGRLLVDYINVAVSTRTTLGAGAITFTYTLTSSADGSPIADADVWVTTDTSGTNVVANGRTNSSGVITFYLDAGTYYLWRQKDGWNFDNPDTEVVS